MVGKFQFLFYRQKVVLTWNKNKFSTIMELFMRTDSQMSSNPAACSLAGYLYPSH